MLPFAQVAGINPDHLTIEPGGSIKGKIPPRRKLIWNRIQFDTHPAKTGPTFPGLVVLSGTTENPSGNFYCRETGYYRFSAQVYIAPPIVELSLYLGLYDLGTEGKSENLVAVANTYALHGTHPSVTVDRLVHVEQPNSYFDFKVYTFGNEVGTLQNLEHYCWASVQFLSA